MLPVNARRLLLVLGFIFVQFLTAGMARSMEFAVGDPPDLADGANLRVMSFNILSEEWNEKTPVDGRQDSVSQTILHFTPDVVGLQEVSVNWYAVLPGLLSEQYEMVRRKNSNGQDNYTGMAYHKEKVRLLESGTHPYSVGAGGTRIRVVTWGHFELIATGATFLVMNTHWCIRQENRMVHAHEMSDLFADLRVRFTCPVITVGDHNSNQNNEAYRLYERNTGLQNARVHAKTVNRAFRTTHSLGKMPRPIPEEAIDQICFTEELICLFYNVLTDQVILDASDHCPIYADFHLPREIAK